MLPAFTLAQTRKSFFPAASQPRSSSPPPLCHFQRTAARPRSRAGHGGAHSLTAGIRRRCALGQSRTRTLYPPGPPASFADDDDSSTSTAKSAEYIAEVPRKYKAYRPSPHLVCAVLAVPLPPARLYSSSSRPDSSSSSSVSSLSSSLLNAMSGFMARAASSSCRRAGGTPLALFQARR